MYRNDFHICDEVSGIIYRSLTLLTLSFLIQKVLNRAWSFWPSVILSLYRKRCDSLLASAIHIKNVLLLLILHLGCHWGRRGSGGWGDWSLLLAEFFLRMCSEPVWMWACWAKALSLAFREGSIHGTCCWVEERRELNKRIITYGLHLFLLQWKTCLVCVV